jgi:hypothetical protein
LGLGKRIINGKSLEICRRKNPTLTEITVNSSPNAVNIYKKIMFSVIEPEKEKNGILFSDSKYVVNGITQGWAKRWQSNGWMRNKTEPAINPDLWEQLLELCSKHEVRFQWVKGHAGNEGNERCDNLASKAASGSTLLKDDIYERNNN